VFRTRCLTALAVVTALVVPLGTPAQAQLGTIEEDVYALGAEVDASMTLSGDPRRASTPADGEFDGAFISVDTAAGPDDPSYHGGVVVSGKEGAPGTSPGHRPKPWGDESPSTGAPVIVVHGFEADARKDCNDFKGLADDLRRQGHPTVVRVRFYDGDRNCDEDISPHWMSGHPHSGPGHRYGSHTQDASSPTSRCTARGTPPTASEQPSQSTSSPTRWEA
jgi:hypothetical protein